MPLKVSAGQFSAAGRKPENQDFHGLCVPQGPQLAGKGITLAVADGISSSAAGAQASEAAVRSFLGDYYCTSEAWSVKTSVERVLVAANSWLFAQTQRGQGRYDKDRGWVCTFSAVVLKSRVAHLFHVGDARIHQLQGTSLEQLTQDHRVHAGGGQSWLGRALGVAPNVEIDYRTVPLAPGDTFVLTTDGVHGFVTAEAMADAIARHRGDLQAAADAIGAAALGNGSDDNVTVQVVRVEELPAGDAGEIQQMAAALPLPPVLAPREVFDGWRIVRELHASSRSHVYLAQDEASGEVAVLKLPSIDLRDSAAYRERFLLEDWIARRIDSPHVLRPRALSRERHALYVAVEHVEGRTLAQWAVDHPRPSLDAVRDIVGQVARGLRAFHRLEMLHQDLRPENVMLDASGTAKIIDFGAVRVAGVAETCSADGGVPGALQFAAPEYFAGGEAGPASDQFSLAVLAYQLLSGRLPYGTAVPQCTGPRDLARLRYRSLASLRPDVPAWVDDAILKALDPLPRKRYGDVDEFAYSLRSPDPALKPRRALPLIERDPLVFWKALSLLLAVCCIVLVALLVRR